MTKEKSNMHTQKTFDFNAQPELQEAKQVEQETSLPPPFIRPDRQDAFGGKPAYEWPAPEHDRNSISVDRGFGEEELTHRFTIHRGDTVEAFFNTGKREIGTVVGISHSKSQVGIAFQESSKPIWFTKGAIYPSLEPTPAEPKNATPITEIVEELNAKNSPTDGWNEQDRVPDFSPYTFDEFKKLWKKRGSSKLTFSEYREAFERVVASEGALTQELVSSHSAPQLKALASRFGEWNAKSNSKQANAESIYQKMLSFFLLDGTVSFAMGESYTEAVIQKVKQVTEEDWNEQNALDAKKEAEQAESLTNPQTPYDFTRFIEQKGQDALSNGQFALWDRLHADLARERRAENGASSTVTQFESDELDGFEFTLKEGYHDKRECPLFIVQLSSRVERTTFMELKTKAKMLGGWYSSFKKSDAGFQFLAEESATKFTELLGGDIDRGELLAERKERKEQTTSERLHSLANTMLERADTTIARSEESLQNTARRAGIQAGVRGKAYAEQALARSLHSAAEALSTGEAKYLDGIAHKTHLETLDTVLYLAKWARIRVIRKATNENEYGFGQRVQEEEEKPYSEEDIRFAKYPQPEIYKRHLEDAILRCQDVKGAKMISVRMAKRIRRVSSDSVSFSGEADIAQLSDFLGRAKLAGVDTEWMTKSLERYNRLQRAHIGDVHELRAALREYLPHKASVRGDDPVRIAERELIGKRLPGFFPTPRPVIEQMLDEAGIEPHHLVLEPSCGKGDIVAAIAEQFPEVHVTAIEQNRTLSDVLSARGMSVEFADFLEHQGSYDRILMNPPFEKGQDMEHVRHAYSLLNSGGRLVAVMSEGSFFRSDKQAVAFQKWYGSLGGYGIKLPEGAFSGIEAFRSTGVRTRLVTLNKV